MYELIRILRPQGRLLIYVWALEQENDSRRRFESQDVMVPWHLTNTYREEDSDRIERENRERERRQREREINRLAKKKKKNEERRKRKEKKREEKRKAQESTDDKSGKETYGETKAIKHQDQDQNQNQDQNQMSVLDCSENKERDYPSMNQENNAIAETEIQESKDNISHG